MTLLWMCVWSIHSFGSNYWLFNSFKESGCIRWRLGSNVGIWNSQKNYIRQVLFSYLMCLLSLIINLKDSICKFCNFGQLALRKALQSAVVYWLSYIFWHSLTKNIIKSNDYKNSIKSIKYSLNRAGLIIFRPKLYYW